MTRAKAASLITANLYRIVNLKFRTLRVEITMGRTKSLVCTAVISLQRACHLGDCSKLFVVDEQCSSCWRVGFCGCRWGRQISQCLVSLPKCFVECNIYIYIYIQLFALVCVCNVFEISCTPLFSLDLTVVVSENDFVFFFLVRLQCKSHSHFSFFSL